MMTRLVIVLLASFMVLGCRNIGTPVKSGGNTRNFYAQSFATSSPLGDFYKFNATLLGETTHCSVYVENGHGITAEQAQYVANIFERDMYDLVRDNFAYESDVDNDGKIILLLLDIQDDYTLDNPYSGYIAGYYNSYHLFNEEYSNQADMIYVDIYPGIIGSPEFFETVVHEFQHLVNFAETYIRGDRSWMDTWINEGLSAAAEYLYSGVFSQERINWYNDNQYGTIREGNNFYTWDNELDDYATVYLFFQWLGLHASNGAGIYKDILNHSSTSVTSVLEAAQNQLYGGENTSWADVLRDWNLALYRNEPTGLWGFNDEFSTAPQFYESWFFNSVLLYPGESVFLSLPEESYTPESPPQNASYTGFRTDTNALSEEAPFTGTHLLLMNTDTNLRTMSIKAPIPSVSMSTPSARLSSQANISSNSSEMPLVWPFNNPPSVSFAPR